MVVESKVKVNVVPVAIEKLPPIVIFAAVEKVQPKLDAFTELEKAMQEALKNYTWANTFMKEIPQAKMYMPKWAMDKIYEAKKPKLKRDQSNHIADEDLADIKTALVKQALTG